MTTTERPGADYGLHPATARGHHRGRYGSVAARADPNRGPGGTSRVAGLSRTRNRPPRAPSGAVEGTGPATDAGPAVLDRLEPAPARRSRSVLVHPQYGRPRGGQPDTPGSVADQRAGRLAVGIGRRAMNLLHPNVHNACSLLAPANRLPCTWGRSRQAPSVHDCLRRPSTRCGRRTTHRRHCPPTSRQAGQTMITAVFAARTSRQFDCRPGTMGP